MVPLKLFPPRRSSGGAKSVADTLTDAIATIGENMNLAPCRRKWKCGKGVVATYMHNAVSDGLGKLGVLVALESNGDSAVLNSIGKQVAMHVAATNPLAATKEEIPADVAEREKAIFIESARESGKPEAIIEKMVEGRMRKFYEESVLLSQTFVIDGENTVEQALKNAEKEAGAPIKLKALFAWRLVKASKRKKPTSLPKLLPCKAELNKPSQLQFVEILNN